MVFQENLSLFNTKYLSIFQRGCHSPQYLRICYSITIQLRHRSQKTARMLDIHPSWLPRDQNKLKSNSRVPRIQPILIRWLPTLVKLSRPPSIVSCTQYSQFSQRSQKTDLNLVNSVNNFSPLKFNQLFCLKYDSHVNHWWLKTTGRITTLGSHVNSGRFQRFIFYIHIYQFWNTK